MDNFSLLSSELLNGSANFYYPQNQSTVPFRTNFPNQGYANAFSGIRPTAPLVAPPASFPDRFSHPPPLALEIVSNPVEEYDDYDEKHLACKRFKRNDTLISAVMSPSIVSSALPVTEGKLRTMRQQVAALKNCLKKEEAEIVELERKNACELETIAAKRQQFDASYQKLSRPITDAQISKFSNYIYDRLQMRRLERLKLEEEVAQPNETEPEAIQAEQQMEDCMNTLVE